MQDRMAVSYSYGLQGRRVSRGQPQCMPQTGTVPAGTAAQLDRQQMHQQCRSHLGYRSCPAAPDKGLITWAHGEAGPAAVAALQSGLLQEDLDRMLAGRGSCWQSDAFTSNQVGCAVVVQVKVVNRELVAILTKGTLMDAEMLQTTPDASYLLAGDQDCLAPSVAYEKA